MGFRVFVSAVSKELGEARLEVARVLRRKGLEVQDQASFTQGGGVLLEKLRDYIASCDAVLCLVGNHTGVFPTPEHSAILGADPTFERYAAATGATSASMTQWEFLLAKTLGKPIYLFLADPAFPRRSDKCEPTTAPSPDDLPTQDRFKAWIKQTGKDRETFATLGKLVEDVLFLPFPDLSTPKPRSSRFATIGSLFKGREDDMDRLRAAPGVGGAGRAVIASKPTSLHALGGVGKTQLAVEFGLAHQDQFDALLFVTGDSPQALDSGLAKLADVLGLPERNAREDEIKIGAALNWLSIHSGWYMVIDNVDDEKTAKAVEALAARLANGGVVITSRLADWSPLFNPLHVDVISSDASVAFLLERTDGKRVAKSDDAAQAVLLARDLDHLALGLEQAGAFISAKLISIENYRDLWSVSFAKVNAWYERRYKGELDYPHSVAATWLTSFDQLSHNARNLLDRLAWFSPEAIPRFLFQKDDSEDALEELIRLSLATPIRSLTGPTGDVSIHRLVQAVTRRRQTGSPPVALRDALVLLNSAFDCDPRDVRSWPRLDSLADHAKAVTDYADRASIAEPTNFLMGHLAMLWRGNARFADAEQLYRRALAIDEAAHGRDHPNVARHLCNLADLLHVTNRHPEAEQLFRRALGINEAQFGNSHPNVAICLNNLGLLLRDADRVVEAEAYFRLALSIDQAVYGENHPKISIRETNLARVLQRRNRVQDAERLFLHALAIDEAAYGPNHPEVASDLCNYAGLLQATGRVGEAEPLFRRALAIDEACYGADHPNVARDLNSLGRLLQAAGCPSEAEPLFRGALAINEACYGGNHPIVAGNLANLAGVLRETNQFSDAESLLKRALTIAEASHGRNHSDAAIYLCHLGAVFISSLKFADAEPPLRRALAIGEAAFGPNHPEVAIILYNLARALQGANRLSDAEPLSRRHLQIFIKFTRTTGRAHPNLLDAVNNYAALLGFMGNTRTQIEENIAMLFVQEGFRPHR